MRPASKETVWTVKLTGRNSRSTLTERPGDRPGIQPNYTQRHGNDRLTISVGNDVVAYAEHPPTGGHKRVPLTDRAHLTAPQLTDLMAQHGRGTRVPGTQLIESLFLKVT